MEKNFIEWDGKQYPVRTVLLPTELGGFYTDVADVDLWAEIEDACMYGNVKAENIDCGIYFYCDSGFIASDPTDEQIVEYLLEHGC